MKFFSFLRRKLNAKTPYIAPKARLTLDTLEDRSMPSATTISGFVYQDANNNGVKDPGESPIANSKIYLRNAQNVTIGQTTTDVNGFYKFDNDASVITTPNTITKTVNFGPQATNFNASEQIDQFDPSLGTLTEVQILHNGTITSEIRVENLSNNSASSINATVGGKLTITAPGINDILNVSDNVGTYNAGVYDGNSDFSGSSGTSFGAVAAKGNKTFTLSSASELAPYIGAGKITVSESIVANSKAEGGGNLLANISSVGAASFTVIYKYIPSANLKPGDYIVVQDPQPTGFLDGTDAINNVPKPNSIGTDFLNLTLFTTDLVNNNFGELLAPQISGFVYHDRNNNGLKEAGEEGIQGASVTLTGLSDQGSVNQTVSTDANGFYQFAGVRPGTYTIKETQPATYLDGKDTVGTIAANVNVSNDQFANIVLPSGGQSVNNNFGELLAAKISGFVYVDANNNGIKDAGEQGIPGVSLQLIGGPGVAQQTAVTLANGYYEFLNLTPGAYDVVETQPAGYLDGKDTVGTQGQILGGPVVNDALGGLTVVSGTDGRDNNFGELVGASISGFVYHDSNNNAQKDSGENAIPGAILTLTGTETGGGNIAARTAVADAAGRYEFTNLKPGFYSVQETQPSGYLDGQDSLGSKLGNLANDLISSIPIVNGDQAVNYNFGEIKASSLSGFVYVDTNNNGFKDAGEKGIAGATVTLGGAASNTVTTDANGFYKFSNLAPGTYTVSEIQPAGYTDGIDTIGTPGGNTGPDVFTNIVLVSGFDGINNNFGEISPENADLGIVKSANPIVVNTNGAFTYTLVITNYGTFTANNVVVTDTLPNSVTFVSYSGTGWTLTRVGQAITATRTSLAVGAVSTITISATAPGAPTTVTNIARVTSSTPDSNPNNNEDDAVIQVIAPPKPNDDLRAMAQGDPLIISKGQWVTNPAAVWVAFTENSAFASALYKSLYGAAANYTELKSATEGIAATSKETFVQTLWNSDYNRTQQVRQAYLQTLGREPSAAEISSGMATLRTGKNELDLAVGLLASAEYQQSRSSSDLLASSLYLDLTGKAPTDSDLALTVSALSNSTTLEVAQTIASSDDAYRRQIERTVRWVLGRAVTETDYAKYLASFKSKALNIDTFAQALILTQEWKDKYLNL